MASFPTGIWTRFVARTNTTPNLNNQPDDHNAMADEIVAVETELGVSPKGTYSDVKTRLDGIEVPQLNSQTGISYTLVLSDIGKLIGLNNAAAQTLVVPPDSAVAFPVGIRIEFRQVGAGQITVSPGAGVSVRSRGSAFRTAGQYSYATLVKVAANTWDLIGDIVV
jgi:hypothetical protein